MSFLFWFCAVLVVYIYLGYPILIKTIAKAKRASSNHVKKDESYQPSVSILIAAFNEEKDIANTLQNKIELDYPKDKFEIIVVSDESEDRTDAIVEKFAAESKVKITLVRQTPRAGKTSGLNLIVPQATGDILVFSDANSIYEEQALTKLVRNFADNTVGYVTGKMVYAHADGSLVGDGCSAYMKYENWMREHETQVGSIVGVDGGIDAMRKGLYETLGADQLPDFVQPLKVVEKGYRVVYEEEALLKEDALEDQGREYTMRVRVSLRALWALHDMRQLLNPLRFGLFSMQLISHKVLRYLAFIPIVVCLFLNIALFNESFVYLITLLVQVLFYAFAWLGKLNDSKEKVPVYFTLPYYFTLLNVACAHATWRYLKGEKQVIWKPRVG
jgi:cellulose synthase/poly-beta-1,6-N-acetylglucosamine synthase-like glycosyltransferase